MGRRFKLVVGFVLIAAIGFGWYLFRDELSLAQLVEHEAYLKSLREQAPWELAIVAFLIYALATGLSFPGATFLTLLVGWFFGSVQGIVIVSFASTTGATFAFLSSRYFFRDSVENRFEKQIQSVNAAFEREGPFYLFSLRLIPAIPFFAINLMMGLTRMKVSTYWWVSQIGMFPATIVYVFAGSQIPDLKTLSEQGIQSVLSPVRLAQILFAFVLLGVFPLAARKSIEWYKRKQANRSSKANRSG